MAENGMLDLAGRTAIVTGASSGLGAGFATTLAGAGANVVLAARRVERLEEVAGAIRAAGGSALAAPCDVTAPEDVDRLVAAAVDAYGTVDVLVNNAGIAADAMFMPEHVPDALFEQTVRVNLMGAWYCAQRVGRRMLQDGVAGSIINVASVAGVGGYQNFPPAYQATKAALINLTRNLACSWGDRGVRVNTLAPGWFPSELTEPLLAIPFFGERVADQACLRRIGREDELAGPLLFLASDASSFMTGQALVIDGGLSASIGAMPYDENMFGLHAAAIPDGLGVPARPGG